MIVGAGLTGLIAAHAFPRETVVEAMSEPQAMHQALLRFRSSAVSDLTGIEFRPVTVRKGIWDEDAYRAPNIQLANLYSKKVLNTLLPRSIWRLEPETRHIAPENFYERLVENVGKRIQWATQADFRSPCITTAPMSIVLDALGIEHGIEFRRAPITVQKFRIADCDVHQTVYFPDTSHPLYRASITGDVLICEFIGAPFGRWEQPLHSAFGLTGSRLEPMGAVSQQYGKIAPIPNPQRKALIARLTTEHNIYSIGRFATWRNILLDDVVHDCAVVKRLLVSDNYQQRLIGS